MTVSSMNRRWLEELFRDNGLVELRIDMGEVNPKTGVPIWRGGWQRLPPSWRWQGSEPME
jgi:hypothetical protein